MMTAKQLGGGGDSEAGERERAKEKISMYRKSVKRSSMSTC